MNQRIEVPFFKGINSSHTREIAQCSDGENFVIEGGALRSRGSYLPYSTNQVRHIVTKGETVITSNDFPLSSPIEMGKKIYCLYNEFIHVYENNALKRVTTTYKDLVIGGTTVKESDIYFSPRDFKKLVTFAGDMVFGYGRGDSSRLHFNTRYAVSGNTFEEMEQSFKLSDIRYWKRNDFIQINGDIVDIVPIQTHLYITTKNGCYRFIGDNVKNFSLTYANSIGMLENPNGLSGVVINDGYYYMGTDYKIYYYSGTSPTLISEPIEELLSSLHERQIPTFERCGTDLWVIYRGVSQTSVFVFDTLQRGWTRFRFDKNMTQTTHFRDTLLSVVDGKVFIYDKKSPLGKDSFSTNPFKTIMTIGFFDIEAQILKIKNVFVNIDGKEMKTAIANNIVNYITMTAFSDTNLTDNLLPETKFADNGSFNGSLAVPRNSIPTFYRFKSRIKGRSLKLKLEATRYLSEIQKIILEVRVRVKR